MLTFQKYYCHDSIRNFFAPKRNRNPSWDARLSLSQHHARWIREMTDGRLKSWQEILLRSDVYWLLFLIIVAFQCQILTTKMEISTFTFNAVALVVLCIGNGIPVRTSVPGKSQVVFKGKFETLQPNLFSFCNSADRNFCGFSSHIKSINQT